MRFSATQPTFNSPTSKVESGAALWQSICAIDRIGSVMFGLPLGTSSYGFPAPETIISDGHVIPQAYLCHIAGIAAKVQEIDDAHAMQRPEAELFEKVFKANQDLRALIGMTPQGWWSLGPESSLADQLLQYWQYYFTARTVRISMGNVDFQM